MKKNVNILIISFTTIFIAFIAFIGYGCSNEENWNEEMKRIKEDEKEVFASLIIGNTVLENNQYKFNLTIDEAISNGMSKDLYYEIQNEILKLNKEIELALKNPEIDQLFITDPQSIDIKSNIPRLKTASEGDDRTPLGCFDMYEGSQYGQGTVTIPKGVKTIYIQVYTKCLGHSVTLTAGGNTYQLTSLLFPPSPIAVTVTPGQIFKMEASTSCSGGGGVNISY